LLCAGRSPSIPNTATLTHYLVHADNVGLGGAGDIITNRVELIQTSGHQANFIGHGILALHFFDNLAARLAGRSGRLFRAVPRHHRQCGGSSRPRSGERLAVVLGWSGPAVLPSLIN
jgi:hypothetical protein